MTFDRLQQIVRLRLRSLFSGSAVDRELDEELRDHVERQIEANLQAGMTPSRSSTRRARGDRRRAANRRTLPGPARIGASTPPWPTRATRSACSSEARCLPSSRSRPWRSASVRSWRCFSWSTRSASARCRWTTRTSSSRFAFSWRPRRVGLERYRRRDYAAALGADPRAANRPHRRVRVGKGRLLDGDRR